MSFWAKTRRTALRRFRACLSPTLPLCCAATLPRSGALTRLRSYAPLLLLCACALTGCLPSSQSQLDEEKEPHFLEGKSRLNARDYKGGLESFERALQVNPHSASAHFELAVLCEQNKQDYAAAIYHFEHFLEL